MERLPSGTVTMVFSDIEGSTRLLSRLGDRYPEALDQQREVMRSAWSQWHGCEMGTEGDSFFVVFASVGDAVRATLAAQRAMSEQSWPNGEVVRVRIGMHTGTPLVHGDGYVGMDVHRAARVAGAAHGGQILMTEAARSEAGDETLREGNLRDLGWHRLKDLSQPEHIFQLSPDPDDAFPPLKSLGTTTSLPVDASPLLAREEQLDDLCGLLRDSGARLVTLTGPGGTGKTRLAIGLAALQAPVHPNGVYFVGLANAINASAMWSSVAQVLGTGPDAGDGVRVLEYLASRRVLLVLDNLEQLPLASEVVATMLSGSPGLVIIATSRRPLHLRSEYEYVVLPLDLPKQGDAPGAERSGAVRLFAQVASMVNPRFELTTTNLTAVVEICRRLDGIPLAIELAAARSKLLSPANLLGRLDRTMGLGSADADRPPRHRTLRSAMQWSYDLLPDDLKSLFCRLGVFADGCDLRAVAAVGGSTSEDALDEVAVLVDLSLAFIVDGPDGEPRVHLLQTIAEFAVERLASSGELSEVRQRHARYYLELARELASELHTERQFAAAARVQPEYANFRAALAWCLRPGSEAPDDEAARTGLELVAVLSSFWLLREPAQARQLLERALELDARVDSLERVAALVGLATVMDEHLDTPRELLLEALGVAERLGDQAWTSQVTIDLVTLALRRGEACSAKDLLERAKALAEAVGDSVRLALAVHVLGEAELQLMSPDRATALFERSRALGQQRGDEAWAVWEEHWVAIAMIQSGHVREASERLNAVVARVLEFSDSLLGQRASAMHGGFRRADGL